MPVEIKELIIKAEFGQPQEDAAAPAAVEESGPLPEDIVEECVRQVLAVLDRKRER